jgi:UDP-GlcNAc:undecaprenyl-phosphate/decaprenyl-phosphate GlcNAc-1-phosphate transferase
MWYPILAFVVAMAALLLLLKTRLATIALDQPNHRSLHTHIRPRTGGLAVISGVIAALVAGELPLLWISLLVSLLTISLMDDIHGLSVRWRLTAQLLVVGVFILSILSQEPWWFLVLMALAITWMINLYNFMDGADGLAGGMAVVGFTSYAVAAWLAGDSQLAAMNASVAAASLAFLLFNFHPARIFLGDAGSVPLGFLAGGLGLYGWQQGVWPIWFPLMVFSPFIVDASVTLLKRLLRGEKVWQAHRNHYYQRLIQLGWGHRKTALAEYVLMLCVGITAIGLLNQPLTLIVVAFTAWTVVYALLMRAIDQRWARRSI